MNFNAILSFFAKAGRSFADEFYLNFIKDSRWKYLTDGLGNTLIITMGALILGIALGFLLALVRTTHDKTGKLGFLNGLARLYLTVIRGTPVVVQLMIIYFVVFASVRINPVVVAIIAFGLNSAAYVAEIFRSGIMSIDPGQMEAGRSLGLNYNQTMWKRAVHAPGGEKRPPGPGQRDDHPAERNLRLRLHRFAGPDQGRRHHPGPDVQRVHASAGRGGHLPGHGIGSAGPDGASGKETGQE